MRHARTLSLPVTIMTLVVCALLTSSVQAEEAAPPTGAELEPGALPVATPVSAGEAPEAGPVPAPIPPPGPMALPPETAEMAAQIPAEQPAIDPDQLRAALVEYRTSWARGIGYLVGDQRTVVVISDLRDRYRRITVRMVGSEGPQVQVSQVRRQINNRFGSFVILSLAEDLPGTPLDVATIQPSVGTSVLILHRGQEHSARPPEHTEIAVATVTAGSRYTLTVGESWNQVWQGSPVFNDDGQVVAFFGTTGFAMRINELLAEVNSQPDRQLVTSVIGLRLGTEFGGFLNDPLTIELEVGIALWDQLGIMFYLGGGLSTGSSVVRIDPVENVHEAGVGQGEHNTLFLGLELEYRLLLTRSSMPFYLDFAIGLHYTISMLTFNGLAFYSTEPNCDPGGRDCGLTVGEPPTRDVEHSVGLSLGVDLRAGPFVIGLRVIPGGASYNPPRTNSADADEPSTTYRLNFGLAWR